MNSRIVVGPPYVPDGVQIVVEGPAEAIGEIATRAIEGAAVFWTVRLAGKEGVPNFSGPKLVQ